MSDINQSITQTISAINDLRGVYEIETKALEATDTTAFLSLQNGKLQKAQAYQSHIEGILSRKDELKQADPALKKKLKLLQNEFSVLSQKNMEALERMRRTLDRLGENIRKAARATAQKQRAFSYSANGVLQGQERARISLGVSETA